MAPLTPTELSALLAMLRRCSKRTLLHRFHGFTDGVAYATELVAPDPERVVLQAWDGERCVGLATLAGPVGDTHMGVLVEDEYQRLGIGRRLFWSLVAEARRRGVDEVRAEVLGERAFIVRLLARAGPVRTGIASGVYSVRLDLAGALRGPGDGPT